MQQSNKRLFFILLAALSALLIHSQTVFAQSEGDMDLVIAQISPGNAQYFSPQFLLSKDDILHNIFGSNAGTPIAQNTPVPLAVVITNTPDQDGIIIHQVKYGETLFTIAEAYGVPIDQILTNSGLSLTTTDIREGQILIIRTATEPSSTPSPTATIDPGTPTPTMVRPTRTPFPTRTPAPTRTPTKPPSLLHQTFGKTNNVGIGLILISGLGLIAVIYLGFLKKS